MLYITLHYITLVDTRTILMLHLNIGLCCSPWPAAYYFDLCVINRLYYIMRNRMTGLLDLLHIYSCFHNMSR